MHFSFSFLFPSSQFFFFHLLSLINKTKEHKRWTGERFPSLSSFSTHSFSLHLSCILIPLLSSSFFHTFSIFISLLITITGKQKRWTGKPISFTPFLLCLIVKPSSFLQLNFFSLPFSFFLINTKYINGRHKRLTGKPSLLLHTPVPFLSYPRPNEVAARPMFPRSGLLASSL